ncbi:MAG: family 16 glycosylhydrolase [Spirochaetales bacterium]|nr:family 16 glycosylhydrolase [Spirochaetales bacterium]
MTTQGKLSWQYARIEARIRLPNAVGSWPAFWMMGTSNDGSYSPATIRPPHTTIEWERTGLSAVKWTSWNTGITTTRSSTTASGT